MNPTFGIATELVENRTALSFDPSCSIKNENCGPVMGLAQPLNPWIYHMPGCNIKPPNHISHKARDIGNAAERKPRYGNPSG